MFSRRNRVTRSAVVLLGLGAMPGCVGDIAGEAPEPMAGQPDGPRPPSARPSPPPSSPGVLPPGMPTSPGAPMAASIGPAGGRRLTREEYVNTVSDLLKMDLTAERALLSAETPAGGGFRNHIDALSPSSVRTTAYEAVATRIAANVKWAGGLAGFAACTDGTAACETGFVRRLGRLFYRRPVTEPEVNNLASLFTVMRGQPAAFEAGARLVLEAVLQSPHFLYRLERADRPPSGPELATRLSYFLWKSTPSDGLLTTAEGGGLAKEPTLEETVQAMLRDDRSRRGLRELVEDWLQLYRVEAREPDAKKGLTAELLREMKEETLAFTTRLALDQPADLMTLFTDRKAELGPSLARLYGLTPTGTGVSRYDLANGQRIGLLTQPSVLGIHASVESASIVDRGLTTLRVFLCGDIPPPPDGATAQFKAIDQTRTDREKFAIHSADPSCAGCHRHFDALGLPFEPYDVIGRFRTQDQHGNPLRSDGAVELDGAERRFANVSEFAALMGASPRVEQCLVQKVYQYAYGRSLKGADDAAVVDLAKRFRASGRTYGALVEALATSAGFLSKEGS